MSTIYLSLGTNVGDRWQSLRAAVAALDGFIEIDAVSPVYETAPWGPIREQPRFLNCCVSGRSELAPELLLVALKQLEKRVGAQQARRFGPRTIDIDLLAMGRVTLQYRHWHLPKRQIEQQAFVLVPLRDIAPCWQHPLSGCLVNDLLRDLDISEVVSVGRL